LPTDRQGSGQVPLYIWHSVHGMNLIDKWEFTRLMLVITAL